MTARKIGNMWDEAQVATCKGMIILCCVFNLIFTMIGITKIVSVKFASFGSSDYYILISGWALVLGILIPVLLYIVYGRIRAYYTSWCLECYLYRGTAKVCPHCCHKRLFGDDLFE